MSSSDQRMSDVKRSSNFSVSDRLKNSPDKMDTSSSSADYHMDVDDSPRSPLYHNRHADEFTPTRPASEMSIYTPTQTETLPPRSTDFLQQLSPIPFPSPSTRLLLSDDQDIKPAEIPEPFVTPVFRPDPVLAPFFEKTIAIGSEAPVFNQVCDVLDKALAEWDQSISEEDKEHNPNTNVILLNIPSYLSELLVYGMRPGRRQYWEGDINLIPKQTRVVKLRVGVGKSDIYGVQIGRIREFWGFDAGVHVFYGSDKCMYVHPGSSYGVYEGEWELFIAKGGPKWNPRQFGAHFELDDTLYP